MADGRSGAYTYVSMYLYMHVCIHIYIHMQIHIGICAAGCRSRLEYPQSRWTRCTPSRPPDVWALCFPDHHRPRSLMLLIDAPVCRPQMLLMCDAPGYWVLCFPDHRQTRSPRPRPPSLLLPPPPPRSCATTYAYMLKYVYPINVFMCLCTRICVHADAAYIPTYMHACCIHACMHTHIHASIPACMRRCCGSGC